MKKIVGCWMFALLIQATAQAQTLYQVELIAFARYDAESEENWDRQYQLRYPDRHTALQANDGSGAAFQQLGSDALQLNREAGAIAARRNWRLLLHTAWRQTVEAPANATAVIISGGKPFGTHRELEGTFTLSVERFLRADANLWLSRFADDAAASAPTVLPDAPGAVAPAGDESSRFTPTQTVLLQEQRRLRSGELHYFDHPRLGLIVLVTPVTAAP